MSIKNMLQTLQWKKNTQFHQLMTTWGEDLDTKHVLMEYPRPQMVREEYLILNGYWDVCICNALDPSKEYLRKILVPFSPESVLSGVNDQIQPKDTLWYRRWITVLEIPEHKRCLLHFGAVDQSCEVYVNQQRIGYHMGGYLNFTFDITPYLKGGENELEVKVTDTSDTSYHARGKQKLKRGGMFYTAQSGIWQTVWIEWVPKVYISGLRITPRYDESEVQFEIMIMDCDQEKSLRGKLPYPVKIQIYEANQRIVEESKEVNEFSIHINHKISWCPENPFLYHVAVSFGEDEIKSYFAMRKISIGKDNVGISRIFLNNEPYFQQGVLDQGYWPDGLYTAPSDQAMIYDIKMMKKLGYNMIRKHVKIEPMRWYYHCDRLGMLVWQDMVNGGEKYNVWNICYLPTLSKRAMNHTSDHNYTKFSRKSDAGRKEWMSECQNTIKQLYNCPCIVTWVPFNEGWGQFDSIKVLKLIREMDRTRLIDHASGWYDQKIGDFKSVHNYFYKLKVEKEERPYVISEYGGYACIPMGHSYSDFIYGYRKFESFDQLNLAYRNLLKEEIEPLIEKGLSAAIYTQVSDVEDEVNGLLSYDRRVCKVSPVQIRRFIEE